jgi:ribosome biogenesis GTPase A
MSSKLEKRIVVGHPNSGKSVFLNQADNNVKCLQFNYGNVKNNSFLSLQNKIKREIIKNINSTDKFIADEPFFIIPICEFPEIFDLATSKSYLVSTHKLSYYLLDCPKVTLMNHFVPENISHHALYDLIVRPSNEFYSNDIINFSHFLNNFNDIYISEQQISKILTDPVMKKMKTTPFIRDGLISIAKGNNLNDYLSTLESFFKHRLNYVQESKIVDIILNQIYPLKI